MSINDLAWSLVLEIADELAYPKDKLLRHILKASLRAA